MPSQLPCIYFRTLFPDKFESSFRLLEEFPEKRNQWFHVKLKIWGLYN